MGREPPCQPPGPVRSRYRTGALLLLLGWVVLLAVTAYFPFSWDPPHTVRNGVARTSSGALHFSERNRARTAGTPAWLAAVRRDGRLRVDLVARPAPRQRYDPVSIMMLASDYWHSDFAIGQHGRDLLVWLRRTGSDPNGDPPYAVRDAFRPGRWTHVRLTVGSGRLRLAVEGVTRLRQRLPPGSLRTWEGGRVALGDEVHGGGPWQGDIRQARVQTPGHVVDYVRPGALDVPDRFFLLPDHVAPFPPPTAEEWLVLGLHLLSFVPVGVLVGVARRPPVGLVPAVLVGLAIALALAGGKFFFELRHMAVADIVLQVLGTLAGVLLLRYAAWPPAVRQLTRTGGRSA